MEGRLMTIQRAHESSYAISAAKKFAQSPEQSLTYKKYLENDGTMVTVVCVTYNQEDYIKDALEGFVMQNTSFKYKVLVGDDCSSDTTPKIIQKYADKYPDIIVPILRDTNLGGQRNILDLCQRANSPYIALCDGDDYWTSPNKLQKQIDIMEKDKSVRASFHNTEIVGDNEWIQRQYYVKSMGKSMIPYGIRFFNKKKKYYSAAEYIDMAPAHTSSMMFRWNYDVPFPEEYYSRASADHYFMMLQIGNGRARFFPDLMSAYRRNETGITISKSEEQHFLKTRTDWIDNLKDFQKYFKKHYGRTAQKSISERMAAETGNYFKKLANRGGTEELVDFIKNYPEVTKVFLAEATSANSQKRALRIYYGPKYSKVFLRDGIFHAIGKPALAISYALGNHRVIIETLKYWIYSFLPKKKNLWVFSSFNRKGYLDNTKYLYEYVSEHHPEIEAYWLTKDESVYDALKETGRKVIMFDEKKAERVLRRASVAFMDHFKCSDYGRGAPGLNYRLRYVQLWHGVGLKKMGTLTETTTVPGVVYSGAMLAKKGEKIKTRLKKRKKLFFKAPYRELCERYFMMVCPSEEMMNLYKKTFRLNEKHFFICGYPRTKPLYDNPSGKGRILYAPTYRWNPDREKRMVDDLIESLESINNCMKDMNMKFYIRLHPHTWRDYDEPLNNAISKLDNIIIDDSKDVYESLGEYDMLITDYSSIAYDYLLLNRPMIFLCPDLDEYKSSEVDLSYDYYSYSPGQKETSWMGVIEAIKKNKSNPGLFEEERKNIRDFFYDMRFNDENNSERIVKEVKKRLDEL